MGAAGSGADTARHQRMQGTSAAGLGELPPASSTSSPRSWFGLSSQVSLIREWSLDSSWAETTLVLVLPLLLELGPGSSGGEHH